MLFILIVLLRHNGKYIKEQTPRKSKRNRQAKRKRNDYDDDELDFEEEEDEEEEEEEEEEQEEEEANKSKHNGRTKKVTGSDTLITRSATRSHKARKTSQTEFVVDGNYARPFLYPSYFIY